MSIYDYNHNSYLIYCSKCGEDKLYDYCYECNRPEKLIYSCSICTDDLDVYVNEQICSVYILAANIIIKKYKHYKIKQILLRTNIHIDIIINKILTFI